MSDWLASVCFNFQAQRASRKPKLQAVAGSSEVSIRPHRNDLPEGRIQEEILWNSWLVKGSFKEETPSYGLSHSH